MSKCVTIAPSVVEDIEAYEEGQGYDEDELKKYNSEDLTALKEFMTTTDSMTAEEATAIGKQYFGGIYDAYAEYEPGSADYYNGTFANNCCAAKEPYSLNLETEYDDNTKNFKDAVDGVKNTAYELYQEGKAAGLESPDTYWYNPLSAQYVFPNDEIDKFEKEKNAIITWYNSLDEAYKAQPEALVKVKKDYIDWFKGYYPRAVAFRKIMSNDFPLLNLDDNWQALNLKSKYYEQCLGYATPDPKAYYGGTEDFVKAVKSRWSDFMTAQDEKKDYYRKLLSDYNKSAAEFNQLKTERESLDSLRSQTVASLPAYVKAQSLQNVNDVTHELRANYNTLTNTTQDGNPELWALINGGEDTSTARKEGNKLKEKYLTIQGLDDKLNDYYSLEHKTQMIAASYWYDGALGDLTRSSSDHPRSLSEYGLNGSVNEEIWNPQEPYWRGIKTMSQDNYDAAIKCKQLASDLTGNGSSMVSVANAYNKIIMEAPKLRRDLADGNITPAEFRSNYVVPLQNQITNLQNRTSGGTYLGAVANVGADNEINFANLAADNFKKAKEDTGNPMGILLRIADGDLNYKPVTGLTIGGMDYCPEESSDGDGDEDPADYTIAMGESAKLNVSVSPSDATFRKISFISFDPSVATVDGNGNIKGIAPGRVTVRATADDALYDTSGYFNMKQYTYGEYNLYFDNMIDSNFYKDFVIDVKGAGVTVRPGVSENDIPDVVLNSYTTGATNIEVPTAIGDDLITRIGTDAFSGNTKVESLILPAGVEGIDDGAFAGCTSLKQISIPVSVTELGEDLFTGCTSLKDIYYGGTEEQWENITGVAVPAGVTMHYQESIVYEEPDDGTGGTPVTNTSTDPGPGGGGGKDPGPGSDGGEDVVITPKPLLVPLSDGAAYASDDDNLGPIVSNKKIAKMGLDLSKVEGSGVDPLGLKMTVIKGSKLITAHEVKEVKVSSKKEVGFKVNKKTHVATLTPKKNGWAEISMSDDKVYRVSFTVQTPKAQKLYKKIKRSEEGAVTLTPAQLYNTTIKPDSFDVTSKKQQAVKNADGSVTITPKEKDTIKLTFKYLNKKYKMTIKVK